MIFIKIQTEDVVQVDDKTRIDINGSFTGVLASPISTYEIEPEAGAGFIDVTSSKLLDWAYATNGTKTITVRVTQDDLTQTTKTAEIVILDASEDNLFSSDADLTPLEPDVLRWVENGRNSFINKHREAQTYILNELDSARIWKQNGSRYLATDIVDIQDFRVWSKYETLRIIFEGISNDVGDIFSLKADKYRGFAVEAKKRATFRLDSNDDGVVDNGDVSVDNRTLTIKRG